MKRLNYQTLKENKYDGFVLKTAPEKVMQFGEGNFLRAFSDYFFDIANEKTSWNGKCLIIKPRKSGHSREACADHEKKEVYELLNEQQGLYTLYLRGMEKGEKVNRKRVISSVSRCVNPYCEEGFSEMMKAAESDDLQIIVSNTTEAGIVFDPSCKLEDRPADSFPGKLTQVLLRRFQAGKGGLLILPCELIDRNGQELRKCVERYIELWKLSKDFRNYVENECVFASTLVDRIVSGSIGDSKETDKLEIENGYSDLVPDVGEVFGTWIIEGSEELNEKLPFRKAGADCIVVPDVTPYKKRKVRILNGAHTGFVPGAFLSGFDIVRDCVQNETISLFMKRMLYGEVIPTMSQEIEKSDLLAFAEAVQDRFNNPFVDHRLLSITLNSTSKWKARILPSLLDYVTKTGKLPKCLTLSFAMLIAFYSTNVQKLTEKGLVCRRIPAEVEICNVSGNETQKNEYICMDEHFILEFYYEHRNDSTEELVRSVMTDTRMWGQNLTEIGGFYDATVENLKKIREGGTMKVFGDCSEGI